MQSIFDKFSSRDYYTRITGFLEWKKNPEKFSDDTEAIDEILSGLHLEQILQTFGLNEKGLISYSSFVLSDWREFISTSGRLKIKFYQIFGNADFSSCGLISLFNSPELITGDFDCSNNQITSLLYTPEIIYGEFIYLPNIFLK